MTSGSKLVWAASASAAIILGGCGDDPTGSLGEDAPVPLGVGAEQRLEMRAELMFANDQLVLAIESRQARDAVVESLIAMADRIETNDRRGFERALENARDAVRRYGGLIAADVAASPDVEALELTINRVAAMASDAEAAAAKTTLSIEDPQS